MERRRVDRRCDGVGTSMRTRCPVYLGARLMGLVEKHAYRVGDDEDVDTSETQTHGLGLYFA